VMELVEGPTLDDVIRHMKGLGAAGGERRGDLDAYPGPDAPVSERVSFAIDLGIQIADALTAAHERGIVHRDVKPSNILLANGRAMVADFGLANVRDDAALTATQERIGTPAYMSPEQALGRTVDARSDLYSLGATLYELVTLRRAIEGHSLQDFFQKIPREDPKPARKIALEVPRDVETILVKSLRKEPEQRYESARDLAEELARYRRGDAIRARPDGPIRKVWRSGKRHPVLRLAVLALLIAILSALTIWQLWPEDPNRSFLTVTTSDGKSHPVKIIPLDEMGRPQHAKSFRLDEGSLDRIPVPHAGKCRIVVGTREAFAEITAELSYREHTSVEAKLVPTADVVGSMVEIPEADYPLPRAAQKVGGGTERIRAFHIDPYEVTKAQFRAFLREVEGADRAASFFIRSDNARDENSPAQVSFLDALRYAAWAGKRLPTAHEWLAAFVAPDGRPPTAGHTIPGDVVRSVGATPEDRTLLGIHDMFGNVGEYTLTWEWLAPYALEQGRTRRVLILGRSTDGMAWHGEIRPGEIRRPHNLSPDNRSRHVGFRCAKSEAP